VGFRPSSRNQDQQRQDRQVRLHEFDQGTASDGRQRGAELGAERHCSGWFLIGSNWELSGEAPNDVKDHDWLGALAIMDVPSMAHAKDIQVSPHH
jgi:hypothetical protein